MKTAIVVGAGAAGCSAAANLVNSGWNVQIFEAKNSIGGRLYSFVDNVTGEEIDNGQHILIGAYKEFLSFAGMLGNRSKLNYQDALTVVFRNKKKGKFIFDTSKMVGDLGKAIAILQFPVSSMLGRIRALRFAKKVIDGKVNPKGISAAELLKKHKQSDDFINSFWAPLITATINAKPRDASAELFVNVLRLGFLGKSEDARIIIPSEGLSSLFEGFRQWLEKSGSQLLLNTKAQELIIVEGACKGIIDSNCEKHYADAVILAIPPEHLKKLLEPFSNELPIVSVLNEYAYSTIISTYLWLDKEIMTEEFSALIDTDAQWVFNRRKLCNSSAELRGKYPGHLAVTISAANDIENMPNEELVQKIWGDINACFRAAANANILHYKIFKDKRATFLASPSLENKRPDNSSQIRGLYFAGDWTDTKLPATIEGAALSGKSAAKLIINNFINEQV